MSEYKRLKDYLSILEQHNNTNIPVFHLTDGKVREVDFIRELIGDCRDLLNKIENGTLMEIDKPFIKKTKYGSYMVCKATVIWVDDFTDKAEAEAKLRELKGEV